jgi:TolB-like protein
MKRDRVKCTKILPISFLVIVFMFASTAISSFAMESMVIIPLEHDETISDQTANLFYDYLMHAFIATGQADVYERSRLDDITEELEFQYGGLVDEATASRVGEMIGAEYAIIGSLYKNGDDITLSLKKVNVETARVEGTYIGNVEENGEYGEICTIAAGTLMGLNLINRSVAVMDFSVLSETSDYNYLSQTLPDTISTALSNTGKFELISSSQTRQIIEEEGLTNQELYNEQIAVNIGDSVETDIVLMGKIQVIGEGIKIWCKAIDLSTGRERVNYTYNGRLGIELFELIDNVSVELATRMEEELPPLPADVVVIERERLVYQQQEEEDDQQTEDGEHNIGLMIKAGYAFSTGLFAERTNSQLPYISLTYNHNINIFDIPFVIYGEIGFHDSAIDDKYKASDSAIGGYFIPISAGFGYVFNPGILFDVPAIEGLFFIPSLWGGISMMNVTSDNPLVDGGVEVYPHMKAVFSINYKLIEELFIFIDYNFTLVFTATDETIRFHTPALGLCYLF